MTLRELTQAKQNGRPVIMSSLVNGEIEYKCVKAILRRKYNGVDQYQAVLVDKCGNSETRCSPEQVKYKEPVTLLGRLSYDIESDRYQIICHDTTQYIKGGQSLEVAIGNEWISAKLTYSDVTEDWYLAGIGRKDIDGLVIKVTT